MIPNAETLRAAYGHHRAGRLREAENLYREVLRSDPRQPDALHLLGLLAQQLGRNEVAIGHIGQAIALRPAVPEFRNNIAESYRMQGMLKEAAAQLREALLLRPDYPEAHNNLANVLNGQGRLAEAVKHYREALRLKPDYPEAQLNLGNLYKAEGRVAEAEAVFRAALALRPNDGIRVKLAMMLPPIPGSAAELDAVRRRFEDNVDALSRQPVALADPAKEVGQSNFLLAHHGRANRELHRKVAALYERACPSLLHVARHCSEPARRRADGRIGIGFVSQNFREHSVGKFIRGLIAHLSRERFHVTVFFIPPLASDDVATFVRQHADAAVNLSGDLRNARLRIERETLDILCYADIGMDPFSYFLAYSRLAPVQCVALGHADTTGIRNLDYFISAANFEPEGAQAHYSEKLVQLKAPVAYYYRPLLPGSFKSRRELGLDDAEHLYVCPQSPFKLHPDFDAILAAILRADPQGRVLLKADRETRHWHELLLQRLGRTVPDVLDRITVLPPPAGRDFINLIAVSDVMLDPIHYGGFTTSLEAFTVGTPVVTWPGEFHRGRATLGLYKDMAMLDCVADSAAGYAALAVRLGTDPVYRKEISDKILARNGVLFENMESIREYERFFLAAMDGVREPS